MVEKTKIPPCLTLEEILKYDENALLGRMYLLHGYALTALGRNAEALPFLREVIPQFMIAKKMKENIDMYPYEMVLPFALIPLCEYMLDPTKEKRIAAWNGREDCMKRLNNRQISEESKLEGYLYYFHLEEAFPGVYIEPEKKKRSPRKKKDEKKPVPEVLTEIPDYPESTRLDVTGEGGVIVQDMDEMVWNFVMRVHPFERFIEKIQSLGGYPVLAEGYVNYTVGSGMDPDRVIGECNRILKEPSLTIEEREAVGEIGRMAMHARDHGAEIQFMYNEHW